MSRIMIMLALLVGVTLLWFSTRHVVSAAERPQPLGDLPGQSVNPVVQWNRTLLSIVRTPKAQPATVHPTRSFAIMHAAIYDAVNAIDRTHQPYAVRVPGQTRDASPEAAAAAAAHELLVALYPAFTRPLDA